MAAMERLAWRVSEFAEALGVSRSKAYEVVAAHPNLVVRIDGALRVSVDRAKQWLADQAKAGA